MPGAIFPEGPAFSGGPSILEAIFPEGPAFFRGTFHARSHFPGRSCLFQGDLPCQGPFSRKVLPFSGGPSMPEAIFPEGPCPSALSLRYFGTPGTVRPLIQEMQRRNRSTYDVCARSRDGYERPASIKAPGRRAFWFELPGPGALVAAGGA